uniref:Chromosome 11 open reading frame 86 n=1 Tax=Sciurus vulgaris TaxID=55149 RepID=A0A8D2AV33_SCIVU
MGTGLRSQSLRGPRHSYGKLQESWGRPVEGPLRRALSLRQGRERSWSQGLDGGAEGLKVPSQKGQPERSAGDTEQLIQTPPRGGRWWLSQCRQVRRKWDSFVTSFPSVTLSRPASPK